MKKKMIMMYTKKTLSFLDNFEKDINSYTIAREERFLRMNTALINKDKKKDKGNFSEELKNGAIFSLVEAADLLGAIAVICEFMYETIIPLANKSAEILTRDNETTIPYLKNVAPNELEMFFEIKKAFEEYQLIHCDDLTDKKDKNE